jgi:hypothetical protein
MRVSFDTRAIRYWGLVFRGPKAVPVYGKRRRLPGWWVVGRDAK